MFGMKKVSEAERLRASYAGQGDEELLRLAEEPQRLTDAAQAALADVMKERGLERRAAATPELAVYEPRERGAEGAGPIGLAEDEVLLYTFRDTYDLSDATPLLEEADIPLRLVDRSEFQPNGLRSSNVVGIVLIVKRRDESNAKRLLHEQLQIFPSGEAEGEPAIALTPATDLTLLVMCDRARALLLVQALSAEGITFLWRDGREDKELPDEDTIAIQVRAAQHALAERMVLRLAEETGRGEEDDQDTGS